MSTLRTLRSLFAKWAFFCCLLLLVMNVVGQDLYSESDLQDMSDEELEIICVQRGFELVKDDIDPSTGLVYQLTHADFVEAAQRCLAIEQEMNELLEQYPELAEELEEEIQKMEVENAAQKAEVDMLQKKLSEAETTNDKKSQSFPPGTAFVSKPKTAGVLEDDLEISEEEPIFVDDASEEQQTIIDDQTKEKTSTPKTETEETETKTEESGTAGLESKEKRSIKDDLTLKALAIEIIRGVVRHTENDLKRIVELMAPVVRPLFEAGETAWKRIRKAFAMVRKSFESSQRSEEEANAGPDAVAA